MQVFKNAISMLQIMRRWDQYLNFFFGTSEALPGLKYEANPTSPLK